MSCSNLERGGGAQFHCMTHLFWACQACSMAVCPHSAVWLSTSTKLLLIAGSGIFAAAWHNLRLISDHIRAPLIVPVIYHLVTRCHQYHKSDERFAPSYACLVPMHGSIPLLSECFLVAVIVKEVRCSRADRREGWLCVSAQQNFAILAWVCWWVSTAEGIWLLIPCCTRSILHSCDRAAS